MHHANADRSKRLRRVLGVLADRQKHSTLAIVKTAGVCAVNSIVAELRANGHRIACTRLFKSGERLWFYQLV